MNDKVRAVFLAAIMALSMIAMGATLAGGAAAADVDTSVNVYDQDRTDGTSAEDLTIVGGQNSPVASVNHDGKTILDGFPANGSSVPFDDTVAADPTSAPFSSNALYEFATPTGDPDDAIVWGPHFGGVQAPVQTDAYDEASLNYQQGAGFTLPSQVISIDFDIVEDDDVDEQEVRIDYDESAALGLQVNTTATADLEGQIFEQGDITAGGAIGANEITSTSIDNAANEVVIEFTNEGNASVSNLEIELVWEAANPVEGIDVDTSTSVDHVLRAPVGSADDRFRLVNNGATGISAADTDDGSQIINPSQGGNPANPAEGIDLDAQGEADGTEITGNAQAFHIWAEQGQDITFVTEENANRVQIYEVDTYEDGDTVYYERGSRVISQSPLPGQAVTWNVDDDLGLEPGEQYFVRFPDQAGDQVAVLDVEELALSGEPRQESFIEGTDVLIDADSNDIGGDVEAWFWEEGDFDGFDSAVGDVIHVEEDSLDGTGETTFRVDPEGDLGVEEGDFQAAILHKESEVFAPTGGFSVVEREDAQVSIESPVDESYFRGDIVPIELDFENTARGTISFGSTDANVLINLTVRDIDGSGDGTVYLNTYQVGHGFKVDSEDARGISENGPFGLGSGDPANESQNHGFFTTDDGTGLVGTEGQEAIAHPGIDITGGSQGGAVLSEVYNYDLRATAGNQAPAEPGVPSQDFTQVQIDDRDTSDLRLWAGPGAGDNELDLETFDADGDKTEDVTQAAEAGILTRFDDDENPEIADGDFLVMDADSTGLTGLLHWATEFDDDFDADDVIDREGDDIITELFDLADTNAGVELELAIEEPIGEVPDNFAQLELNLDDERVLGASDGINFNRYLLPIKMAEGEGLSETADRELRAPQPLDATFTLSAEGGAGDRTPNDLLAGDNESVSQAFDFVTPMANINTAEVDWNAMEDRVEVPRGPDYTIPGITNVAAGTNLTVTVQTTPGQQVGFHDRITDIFPTEAEEGDGQVWSADTDVFDVDEEAFEDADEQVDFEIRIRRAGTGDLLNPQGEPVSGVILGEPTVDVFEFADQTRNDGDVVRVASFAASAPGYVAIYNEDDEQLGISNRLDATSADSPHERIWIELDPALEQGEHDLTAVAYRADGETTFKDDEGEDVTRSATVDVSPEAALPADFEVSDLDPADAELDEPGATVDVTATITNTGDESAEKAVQLLLDDAEQDSENVELDGGDSTTVEFELDTSDLEHGTTYIHAVATEDDSETGTLTIAEAPDEDEDDADEVDEDDTDPVVDEDEDDADDDGAGFGVVVAALALLGAALLAIRRQVE